MQELAIVMIGMDGYQEWTKPAIKSVKKHMPDARLVVIDHGRYPYPPAPEIVRIPTTSYSAAINHGVSVAGTADWYLILNNDILVSAPLDVTKFDPGLLYGRRILINGEGFIWIDSWMVLISRQVWDTVGMWDERFLMCGFEDADYCKRAQDLGIAVDHAPWKGVKHFWGKTRWKLPGYAKQRLENRDYFEKKHGIKIGEVAVLHDD